MSIIFPKKWRRAKKIHLVKEKKSRNFRDFFVIDVRIIGEEYKDKDFTGRQYCEEKGIELFYNKRDHRFSSTDLRKRIFEAEKAKAL